MTPFGIALVAGIAVVVLLVVLEGKRQERVYGKPSARPNLAGAGMLELQKHLQADRRVDTLVEQLRDEAGETREDDGAGDGPRREAAARGGPNPLPAPPASSSACRR